MNQSNVEQRLRHLAVPHHSILNLDSMNQLDFGYMETPGSCNLDICISPKHLAQKSIPNLNLQRSNGRLSRSFFQERYSSVGYITWLTKERPLFRSAGERPGLSFFRAGSFITLERTLIRNRFALLDYGDTSGMPVVISRFRGGFQLTSRLLRPTTQASTSLFRGSLMVKCRDSCLKLAVRRAHLRQPMIQWAGF